MMYKPDWNSKMADRAPRFVNRLMLAASIALASAWPYSAIAQSKPTVAYIAPSLDISYWQWVAYGVKQRAQELGMNYVEFTSENSPAKQMDNVRTALTRGVSAIVMGPVSSTSTPPVLRLLKSRSVPVAFAGIGPESGQTDYTSAVTANNFETGKAEGARCRRTARTRRNT
jgi:ribose transport system substrate-binding protein